MNTKKENLEDVLFYLEIAARNLHKAHSRIRRLDNIAKSEIDRAVTAADEALYLMQKAISKE